MAFCNLVVSSVVLVGKCFHHYECECVCVFKPDLFRLWLLISFYASEYVLRFSVSLCVSAFSGVISLYLVEGFQQNLPQIFVMWDSRTEKVSRVKGQSREHTSKNPPSRHVTLNDDSLNWFRFVVGSSAVFGTMSSKVKGQGHLQNKYVSKKAESYHRRPSIALLAIWLYDWKTEVKAYLLTYLLTFCLTMFIVTDLYILWLNVTGCVTGQSRNSESGHSQGEIIWVEATYSFS